MVAATLPWQAALAADEGSLDNIWSEQGQRPQQQQAATSGAPSGTAAPMCTVEELKKSPLVQKGGWSGIGPFKAGDDANDMADAYGNHLRMMVSGDRVTAAELLLLKDKPGNQDLLDLQMAADYLLEAVGTKAKKIARVNADMEKSKQSILFKSDSAPVSLFAGRTLVSLGRQPGQGADRWIYSIRVNSRDVSADVLKSVATGSGTAPVPGGSAETPIATSVPETVPIKPTNPPPTTATTSDTLKDQFAGVLQAWQKTKKKVVRERHLEDLNQALSGKALARQSDAIKWLINNHKYYEMTPQGITVYHYTELSPGTKYSVIAQVKEASKLIDEPSGKVIKEASDSYKVNYTIEKIDDRWLITDSAIVPAAVPATQKAQSGKDSH